MNPSDLCLNPSDLNFEHPLVYDECEAAPPNNEDDFQLWWLNLCSLLCNARLDKMAEGIHPEIFDWFCLGHRILVMREPAEEMVGTLHIPERYQMDNACGWVLNVGTEICTSDSRYPSVSPYQHPLDLVGKKVTWGANCGYPLIFQVFPDSGFEAQADMTLGSGRDGAPIFKYLEMSVGDLHSILHPKEDR